MSEGPRDPSGVRQPAGGPASDRSFPGPQTDSQQCYDRCATDQQFFRECSTSLWIPLRVEMSTGVRVEPVDHPQSVTKLSPLLMLEMVIATLCWNCERVVVCILTKRVTFFADIKRWLHWRNVALSIAWTTARLTVHSIRWRYDNVRPIGLLMDRQNCYKALNIAVLNWRVLDMTWIDEHDSFQCGHYFLFSHFWSLKASTVWSAMRGLI